jgi:hypothetical protein
MSVFITKNPQEYRTGGNDLSGNLTDKAQLVRLVCIESFKRNRFSLPIKQGFLHLPQILPHANIQQGGSFILHQAQQQYCRDSYSRLLTA